MKASSLRSVLIGVLAGAQSSCVRQGAFEEVPCGGPSRSPWLEALSLEEPADTLQLWSSYGEEWSLDEGTGQLCASAEDPESCAASYSLPDAQSGAMTLSECLSICLSELLLVEREGEVEVVDDEARLRELLGPVDDWGDAVLMARLKGYSVGCGDVDEGGWREVEGGFEVLATRHVSICSPVEVRRYQLLVREDGQIEELADERADYDRFTCIGRRPEGLCPQRGEGADERARWLSVVAGLEGAAVVAFSRMEAELAERGAPPTLLSRLRRAGRDERRHARRMGRVARALGGAPAPVEVEAPVQRGLEEIALDNAVEGCAREAWGALLAGWMAERCPEPALRHEQRRIARDEARHAELSWAVAAWLEPQLEPEARARVQAARAQALEDLGVEEGPLQRALGLPDQQQGQTLLLGLRQLCEGSARGLFARAPGQELQA
jgi:hypothetical protein